MERMSIVRRGGVIVASALACAVALACSDAQQPPPIADPDGSAKVPVDGGGTTIPPCSEPAPGCPCDDAGAQSYCGLVYRISGTHVDCSPGYLTCQEDGGWGDCLGAEIYDGN